MERRKYYFRERSRDNNGRGETERASTRERQRQKDKNPSVISSPRKGTEWREAPASMTIGHKRCDFAQDRVPHTPQRIFSSACLVLPIKTHGRKPWRGHHKSPQIRFTQPQYLSTFRNGCCIHPARCRQLLHCADPRSSETTRISSLRPVWSSRTTSSWSLPPLWWLRKSRLFSDLDHFRSHYIGSPTDDNTVLRESLLTSCRLFEDLSNIFSIVSGLSEGTLAIAPANLPTHCVADFNCQAARAQLNRRESRQEPPEVCLCALFSPQLGRLPSSSTEAVALQHPPKRPSDRTQLPPLIIRPSSSVSGREPCTPVIALVLTACRGYPTDSQSRRRTSFRGRT